MYLPLKTSQHLHEFPLILIFGIATSPIIIHRLLPHAVSSLLCLELFQSLSCKEHLTTVLDKVKVKNFTSEIQVKRKLPRSSWCDAMGLVVSLRHQDAGSILGLAQWVKGSSTAAAAA